MTAASPFFASTTSVAPASQGADYAVVSLDDKVAVGLAFSSDERSAGEQSAISGCVRSERTATQDLSLLLAEFRTALNISPQTVVGLVADLPNGLTAANDIHQVAREHANANNCFLLCATDGNYGVAGDARAVDDLVEAARGAGISLARVDLAAAAIDRSGRRRLRRGFEGVDLTSRMFAAQDLTADMIAPAVGTFIALRDELPGVNLHPANADVVAPDGLAAGQVGWSLAALPAPISLSARDARSIIGLRRVAVLLVAVIIALVVAVAVSL